MHPALDGADTYPRIEPTVKSQKGGGHILWPHLQPEEAERSEHETGTDDHRVLARKREEPRPKHVMIGRLGRDPSLEHGAT